MNRQFVISGGRKLEGRYPVQGNKNAALALISAALLTRGEIDFSSVPQIADVQHLVEILKSLGVEATWQESALSLNTRTLQHTDLPDHLVEKLRGSILLLGALAPSLDSISCARPGGCPIGRRSFDIHWDVFRAAGFAVQEDRQRIELQRREHVVLPEVYLKESSVTATENALVLFSALGSGIIENPAREPHVLSLIEFLGQLGAEIELHPLYYRIHQGVSSTLAERVDFRVSADYTDAGTAAIAAAVTGGEVILCGISKMSFSPIQQVLELFGIHFEYQSADTLKVSASKLCNPANLTAGLWPSFPTDLVSLAIVLATKGNGLCLVHDWMYESRMFFIDKLVRMGARITMCDPHRVMVEGSTQLRGTQLESPDIRAGMALVVAGLCADGTTVIEHAEVIRRGYEKVSERLAALGADISEQVA